MASTALLRRFPSTVLSSPQISYPLRPSRAIRVLVAWKSHHPFQVASSSVTRESRAVRSPTAELLQESLHRGTEEQQDARELNLERRLQGVALAMAMACPLLATTLMAPHDAAAAMVMAMESGVILRLSAAEIDPGTAKLAITVLGPLFAAFNLMFVVRIVMSWYPQLPVGKFPFSIAYAPTEPVLGPTRRLIPPVGGVDVAPVFWVALISFLNEILLGQQGLLVLLSQQQP